ncbi:L,D-transpeptidase [Alkalihalobacillus sp. CinArs1]|uniref:L,D-transpeptidase n=1 Tax=Alkalihalobacillus sp. CinArs1 TaxID=2995314 RepID=UPI0022DD938A|nr:L,D-transpeptidase [Alkalihalobacillus sp. CinArs1]
MLLTMSVIFPLGDTIVGDPYIIVNKKTNQVAFIQQGRIEKVLPVATGKSNELTPEGTFTIVVKAVNPYYRKKNIAGGDKQNPLGTRWIGFDAEDTDGRIYGLHGTNKPSSIGKYVTAGCVRLHNEEIEKLFEEVPIGTKVLITTSPESFETLAIKVGALSKQKTEGAVLH